MVSLAIYQFIGVFWYFVKYWLVLEKGLELRKPLWAERGEGWADLRIRCLLESIRDDLFWA